LEIKRTAQKNGGTPLGLRRFIKETDVIPYDIEKHWSLGPMRRKKRVFLGQFSRGRLLLGEFLANKGISGHRGVPVRGSQTGVRREAKTPACSRQKINKDRDCTKAGGQVNFHRTPDYELLAHL
jgi:hypothetical protein